MSQKLSTDNKSEEKAEIKAQDSWGFGSARFTGSYSNSSENTRDTYQSARYEITVVAPPPPVPEGMAKLMDVFASTIVPIHASGGGQ